MNRTRVFEVAPGHWHLRKSGHLHRRGNLRDCLGHARACSELSTPFQFPMVWVPDREPKTIP